MPFLPLCFRSLHGTSTRRRSIIWESLSRDSSASSLSRSSALPPGCGEARGSSQSRRLLRSSFLPRLSFAIDQACFSIAGIVYVGFSFAHLILLRFLAQDVVLATPAGDMTLGCAFLWIMFLGTWSSDTFAYFAGSFFGRRKLCPAISPKKTVEGFLGGLVGTTAVVAALGCALGFSVPLMALLGVLLALTATVGDLAESVIKRYAGIKDSGRLIPGHGGVLDRFDSVMFTAPFVYYFIQVFGLAGV